MYGAFHLAIYKQTILPLFDYVYVGRPGGYPEAFLNKKKIFFSTYVEDANLRSDACHVNIIYLMGAFHELRMQFYMLFGPPPPPFFLHVIRNRNV